MARLIDAFGRQIDYLRISITDRCNLSCRYCTPFEGACQIPHNEILTYEEILRVAEAAVLAGISKIRLTGGEPLLRKGMVDLCRMLANIEGLDSLTLTTNGVLLHELALPLVGAGVRRINISLDTLKPERFKKITGHDLLFRVLAGIKRSEEVGLYPIKISTVLMRGINEDEIEDRYLSEPQQSVIEL
jgi:cyclic pyranopterin phosphate synthase